MSRIKILPYKRFSASARSVARALRVKRIISPRYRQRLRETIINWGASRPSQSLLPGKVVNVPQAVILASNKLLALKTMKAAGVPVPEFTTDRETAKTWLIGSKMVVARTLLNSHSGKGAVVVEVGQELPPAPLYTKYFRRDAEYRVHVFKGRVIDVVKKKRRQDYETRQGFNPHIRTHSFGWIFARDGVVPPDCITESAKRAVACLGLDFGAVDVLYRDRPELPCVVLEVNTAPGLEGTTLTKYVEAIRGLTTNRVP